VEFVAGSDGKLQFTEENSREVGGVATSYSVQPRIEGFSSR
jgi:hypothetical protein